MAHPAFKHLAPFILILLCACSSASTRPDWLETAGNGGVTTASNEDTALTTYGRSHTGHR